ncbi:hypothetical protein AB6D92_23675 [Vibrio splendidus]
MRKVVEYFIAMATAIGLLFAAYQFSKTEFEKLVTLKLEPYQKLLIATSMNDEDKAIQAFDDALIGMEKQGVDGELISAVVNPFLRAIANSDMPYKYEHYTNKLVKLVGNKFPLDYDNANSLGWIFLVTDKNDKAIEYFKKSISLYKQADFIEEAANSYEGLQYSYLASGNLIDAINANEKSWGITYDGYNPQALVWYDHKKVHWIKRLYGIYPKMEKSQDALIAYLNAVYELKPKMEPQPIDIKLLNSILEDSPVVTK